MLAASYPFLDVLWSMVIFFLFFIWICILFKVFSDLFRRRDIEGGMKAVWFVFVILLPFLGVFVYLLAEGHKMADRDMEHMQAARAQQDAHIKSVAGSSACRSDHPGEAVARQRRDHPGRVRHDEGEGARLAEFPSGWVARFRLAQPNPVGDRASTVRGPMCDMVLAPTKEDQHGCPDPAPFCRNDRRAVRRDLASPRRGSEDAAGLPAPCHL